MPFPTRPGRGGRRGLARLDALLEPVREANEPPLDLVVGKTDVRYGVELTEPQAQPPRRIAGVLAQLLLGDRDRPGAGAPGVPEVGRERFVVVGGPAGVGADDLVQLAVFAVVFARLQGHGRL